MWTYKERGIMKQIKQSIPLILQDIVFILGVYHYLLIRNFKYNNNY